MKIRLKSEELTRLLAQRSLSLRHWAQKLDLASGHLSELANGKRPHPTPATRRKLLRGLGVEFEDLFEIEEENGADAPAPPGPPAEGARDRRPRFSNHGSSHPRPTPRRMLPMTGLAQDLGLAFRSLRRRPGFSLATIVVLGLGIGATLALFQVVYATLFKAYPYPEAERLYLVREVQESGNLSALSFPAYLDYEEQAGDAIDLAAWDWEPYALAGGDRPLRVGAGRVTANFQRVIGAPMALGRWFTEAERAGEERLVVLRESLWRESFGADPAVVGRTVLLDGETATVIGVASDRLDEPGTPSSGFPCAPEPATT